MKRIFLLAIITALFISFSTFISHSVQENDSFDKTIAIESRTIAEVFHHVKNRYFEPVNPKQPITQALKSFVSHLDGHSDFLDKESYTKIIETTQGEFYGIGVVIDSLKKLDDEFLKITDIIPAGPADKAQLRAEDKIIQVDNQTLKGLSVDEIIAKIKGAKGTKVHLKIIRPGNTEILSFDIPRDIVKEQNALCYHLTENNIFYLALNMFTENSIKQLENLLSRCLSQECKGIILDLRNNSGGLLNVVIDIAGMFLPPQSLVVVTKDKNQKVIDRYLTTRKPIFSKSIPIFILMNNYTASAAEILAGCLQAYAQKDANIQVFLVGTTTFGKGSVQEVIPLSNECALKLTTALYYLPSDTCIQNIGIKPDFEIQPRFSMPKDIQWFTNNFGYENSIKNSIKNPTQELQQQKEDEPKEEKKLTWKEKKEEQISNDYLILSAVRLIEMLHTARKAYPNQFENHEQTINFLKKQYTPHDKLMLKEVAMEER